MNYMIFDVETTTRNKGSPYTQGNRLCWIGYKYKSLPAVCVNLDADSGWLLPLCTEHTVVGVNLKFDLEWYRKSFGILPERIFDLQIAFFILRNQKHPFPSLNEMAEFYGLGKKLDVVAEEYWERGIDTPDVPDGVMREYLSRDLELTEQVFLKILEEIDSRKDPNLMRLIQIHNMDLLVLMSMQSNGIRYNKEKAENYKNTLDGEIQGVLQELGSYCPGVPVNFDSGDHLSRLLFGGTISVPERVAVGNYKTGAKIGQLRYRIEHKEYELPGFVKPKKEWALKKEGFYATREAVLRQINKPVTRLLLRYAELIKLREYFVKLPQLIEEKGWENDTLHGNFNQQVAVTGRLSSSDPNLQNMPPEVCQMLEPHNGLFVGVDAKALEWVAVVYLSQDPVGMKEIIDGVDQHSVNQKAFGLPSRHIAKIFVFR